MISLLVVLVRLSENNTMQKGALVNSTIDTLKKKSRLTQDR